MAWVIFHTFMEKLLNGAAVDLDNDDIRCMLIDVTRAPVQATDTSMTDIDDNEVSGDNYVADGDPLTNESIALAGGTVTFDADDVVWAQGAAGFTDARYAVLYKYTGTPAAETPICYADLGGDKGNNDGDLTLELAADGIFTLAAA